MTPGKTIHRVSFYADHFFVIEVAIMDRRLVKAARAALGWSQAELAERAGVQRLVIVRYEAGTQVPHARTMHNIVEAFRAGGVEEMYREDGAMGIIITHNGK